MTKFTKTLLATSILLCFSASSYAATGADNDYFGEKLTVDGKTVDSVDFTQNKYEIGSSDTNDVVLIINTVCLFAMKIVQQKLLFWVRTSAFPQRKTEV